MHPIFAHLKRLLPLSRGDADIPVLTGELHAYLEQHAAPPELIALAAGLPELYAYLDARFAQFEHNLELKTHSLHLSSEELLGINEELREALANRESAIAQLQSIASRLDHPDAEEPRDEPAALGRLIERISWLVDEQQKQHAAIRALHTDLSNQKFAVDQHAIVSISDLDGNIIYANDRFCDISGYRREELLGNNHRIVNSGYHPSAVFSTLWQTISAGKVWHDEIRNRKKNGDFYWVDATIVPLMDPDGQPQQYVAIRTDITERKRIEQDLLAAKEAAEAASRAKTEFLSNMSHELRTPMNAILGFSQLLQADNPTTEQAENLNEILRAGHHLLDLINEILDLARIESGRLDLNPEPLFMAEVIGECLRLIQPTADKNQISLGSNIACLPTAQAPQSCLCPVFADRLRLRQVLLNLLSNAIKYNRPGGRVDIDCNCIDDQIRISVTDTGNGIAPELQPHLFKPFERLESSLLYESSIEGTGIGLAISKQLIEAMGGTIGVHSTPAMGSTFWVALPKTKPGDSVADAAPASPSPTPDIPMPLTPSRTLLYVEDNPANVRLVQKIVAMQPELTLLDAPNAEIGLALAEARLPDLILMDINLPGMNGYEALRQLRENPVTRHIPVIAVSANAMQRDIEQARQAGFEDYLTKPLDIPRFLTLVNSLLGGKVG